MGELRSLAVKMYPMYFYHFLLRRFKQNDNNSDNYSQNHIDFMQDSYDFNMPFQVLFGCHHLQWRMSGHLVLRVFSRRLL